MKKTFSLLTLLLLLCTSEAWAVQTLFSTDFKETGWSSLNSTETAQTLTIGTKTVYVRANNTGNLPSVNTSTGTLTWGNRNFSNKDCYIAIPVDGVNGSVTVTVANGSTETRVTYATSTSSTVANPSSTTNTSSAAPTQVTIEGIEGDFIMVYLGRQGSGLKQATSITITTPDPAKEISTQELSGVKVGTTSLTKDAGTNGYSVSGTTITLTDDQQSATTPANVKLVNHIVYTDESTEDDDVDVSFDGTVTAGYYEGTATIDETDYTVKVKKSVSPTLTLSASSADVTLKSYEVVKANGKNLDPVKVTLTGANLTDGEYDVSAEGLTISPASFTVADGEVSQEFSINTTSTTAESTDINFTVGELTETFTLNLTRPAKRSVSQSIVTEATTWDWANSSTEEILLTKVGGDDYTFATDPARDADFLMAILPEVNNNASFNSQALMINTQYVKRTGDYFQGSSVKFKTNLSGQYSVIVQFSNTGKRDDIAANRRYLYIDGTNTNVYSLNTDTKTATATLTLDGTEKEIVINAFTGEGTPKATMVRIKKIIFTTISVTVGSTGYATYVNSDFDLNFTNSDIKAYRVDEMNGATLHLEQLNNVKAGTPVILAYEGGKTESIPVMTGAAAAGTNLLVAGTGAEVAHDANNGFNYVMVADEGVAVFQRIVEGHPATVNKGKAYLSLTSAPSAPSIIRFVDEENNATNINNVDASEEAVKFIENGRILIKKNGIVYDALGRVIR